MAPNPKVKFTCSHCYKTLASKNSLQDHERTHTGEKPHTCEFCSKSFAASSGLAIHRRTHTGEKSYNCLTCGKLFGRSNHLKLHQLIHTGERQHKCEICDKSFKRRSHLTGHRKTHTGEKVECTFCGKEYGQKWHLDRHFRVHTGEKPFACTNTNCERTFYTNSELTTHKNICPLDPTSAARLPTCAVCQRQFTSKNSVSAHMITQHKTDPPKHSCDECGHKFKLRGSLLAHQKTHSAIRSQQCSFCKSTFTLKANLNRHILRMHTGEKSFVCPSAACGSRFYSGEEMMAHNKRIHLKERPYTCPHCGKPCTNNSELTTHIQTHTTDRPYSCDVCEQRFTSSRSLKNHVSSHLGEKPYACSECGVRYRFKVSVTRHMLSVHDQAGAEAAKRQCGVCQKYVAAYKLSRHEKIHGRDDSQRHFKCDTCPKSFYTKDDLKTHRLIHGTKTHICEFCSKAFHVKSGMDAHLRTHTRESR